MSDDAADQPEFSLTRVVDAPRDVVWRLWTDPGEMAHWFHPVGMSTPRETISADVRVGGRYRYTMVDDDSGEETRTGGEYLEVDEPARLVFTWATPDDPVDTAPVVTVTLADLGERTELTFHLRGIEGRPGDDFVHDGWDQALDHLAERAAQAR